MADTYTIIWKRTHESAYHRTLIAGTYNHCSAESYRLERMGIESLVCRLDGNCIIPSIHVAIYV